MEEKAWIYNGKEFDLDPEDYFGFVYLIENNITGKKYIGKKQFWSVRRLPPLKGKKRKRKVIKESNWKKYWGSSDFLKEDIAIYGKENYTRTILLLCTSKSSLTYNETRLLFIHEVLYAKNDKGEKIYFNGSISGKYHYREEIEKDLQRS